MSITSIQLVRELVQTAALDWQTLFCKWLSNFCCNLALRHLVNCFNTNNAPTESLNRKPFFELILGLAGAKDQNRFCAAKMRDHLIIVSVAMAGILSVPLVVRQAFFYCKSVCVLFPVVACDEQHL